MNTKQISNVRSIKFKCNINLDCSVSEASNEIMLNRISEGEDPEFPFNSPKKDK